MWFRLSFPGITIPSWVIEGLATWYESALTDAGRVHGTFHEMVLRTASARRDASKTIGQAGGNSPEWPAGRRRYVYGLALLRISLEEVRSGSYGHPGQGCGGAVGALSAQRCGKACVRHPQFQKLVSRRLCTRARDLGRHAQHETRVSGLGSLLGEARSGCVSFIIIVIDTLDISGGTARQRPTLDCGSTPNCSANSQRRTRGQPSITSTL